MKKFVIEEKVLNEVLTYLGHRPYVETFKLIEALQQNASLLEEKAEESKADEKPGN